uniref:ATP synthase subunit s, mitochondrial n=1 Tax=Cacopsylla melanoneura TaxID=428564 RepID=A0A8D8ZWS0_9HEMI
MSPAVPIGNTLLQAHKSCLLMSRPFMNYVFNRVSEKRRKEVGPDRSCAEWLMRNGAYVRWMGQAEFVGHYNLLPLDKKIEGSFHIEEVKADQNASITYFGFAHFVGCKHLNKLTLDGVKTIDDRAMHRLNYLKDTLKYLYVGDCKKVTDASLPYLTQLTNLKQLHLKNLSIKDYTQLEEKLPSDCKITIE